MQRRTQVVLGIGLALLLAVGGAMVVALVPRTPTLQATWTYQPPAGAGANAQAVAVGSAGGRTLVFAPENAPNGSSCRLVALDAARGGAVWNRPVPAADCGPDGVAQPTVAEWQGRSAVLVAMGDRTLYALDPASGSVRARYDLTSPGATAPAAVSPTPGAPHTLVVVDANGTAMRVDSNATVAWRTALGSAVRVPPVVGDLLGTGGLETAVGTRDGRVVVLDRTGSATPLQTFDSPVTGLAAAQLDHDPARELVVSTAGGRVAVLDAATGAVQWSRTFAGPTAVRAVADVTGDGTPEVFVATGAGEVRALKGDTGQPEWARKVVTGQAVRLPPPVLGDVTGDEQAELVVASPDGRVAVLNPATGTTLASYRRAGTIATAPTLADVDGDGRAELLVTYADGTVVRLDYQ